MSFHCFIVNSVLCASLAGMLGCCNPLLETGAATLNRAELDARISMVFTNAVLYKPSPPEHETLVSTLAPLLVVQQGIVSSAPTPDDRFATVPALNGGGNRPALYGHQQEITIAGRLHSLLTFVWCVFPEKGSLRAIQGFQMTLNSAGHPILWEPLTQPDQMRIFFVARSLEEAAANQHGPPHAERRHAIEGSPGEQPRVVVARIIDDGPIPMGPMVYIQARSHLISTILCRCMPAQVSSVDATREYELLPLDDLLQAPLPDHVKSRVKTLLNRDPQTHGLESSLRLPSAF